MKQLEHETRHNTVVFLAHTKETQQLLTFTKATANSIKAFSLTAVSINKMNDMNIPGVTIKLHSLRDSSGVSEIPGFALAHDVDLWYAR